MNYNWSFAPIFENWQVLAIGAVGTLRLFVICLVIGMGLGLVVALGRRAEARPLRWLSRAFVEVFRNTPVLVQILWFYYALPILAPVEIGPFTAAILGISLNSAAYSAEIFRGGIQSIEPGQWEAARAIAMTPAQVMRRVILPQAVRRIVPALTNRGVEIFKMSTLASVVAYVELLNQGKLIASIYFNPLEVYTIIAALFFLLLYPIVRLTYALERRLARSDA
ncbi:amino acid ABC transporter permease [uncultured Jannaschia sp.]|uniref:amino acid ABC transporter permease n=1 Tax=uncultured Jannaschia sp. TaxID=293347 RepID=UPI00260D8CAD|nr:amino acid ABC transporter permease [uncultured Jannaschia sp.]